MSLPKGGKTQRVGGSGSRKTCLFPLLSRTLGFGGDPTTREMKNGISQPFTVGGANGTQETIRTDPKDRVDTPRRDGREVARPFCRLVGLTARPRRPEASRRPPQIDAGSIASICAGRLAACADLLEQ